MAKDDYFVLAYKILAYLYECIKGKKKLDFSYLQPMTKDFLKTVKETIPGL